MPAAVDIFNESTTAAGAILEMNDFAEETDVALDMSVKISFGGEDFSAVNSLGGFPTDEGDDFIANANEVLSVNAENSSISYTAEDAQSRSDGGMLIMSAGDNRGIVDETMLKDVDLSKEDET